jgi:hypothetical protein
MMVYISQTHETSLVDIEGLKKKRCELMLSVQHCSEICLLWDIWSSALVI